MSDLGEIKKEQKIINTQIKKEKQDPDTREDPGSYGK